MIQPLEGVRNDVNPNQSIDSNILALTNGIKCFLSVSPEGISKYIPHRSGIRVTSVFMVLCLVNSTPTTTCSYLAVTTHCNGKTVKNSMGYLIELSLVQSIPAMRYIVPFNSYKQEKTYFITKKGKYVLSKLLDY